MALNIETHPVEPAAQRALAGWILAHRSEVALVLKPFGLTPNDIGMPVFQRIVVVAVDDEPGLFLGAAAATPAFGSTRVPLPEDEGGPGVVG